MSYLFCIVCLGGRGISHVYDTIKFPNCFFGLSAALHALLFMLSLVITLSRNSVFMVIAAADLLVYSTQIGCISDPLVTKSSSLPVCSLLQKFTSIMLSKDDCAELLDQR